MSWEDFKHVLMWIMVGIVIIILYLISVCVQVTAREYTPNDIVEIAKVTQHEAGNQSELGQRLVIDTVLNRVESEEFPNTVTEVLRQPGQYCNPRIDPPDHLYLLIAQEIETRTNSQVLWFRKHKYHSYGVPIVKEGLHYFSGR